MRQTLLCLLFVLAVIAAPAQNVAYGNFKVADQEIFYQKIFFQEGITIAKVADYYKTLPYLSNVEIAGDEVTFDMNDVTVDYKKFQFTQVATPSIIQTGRYSGKGSVGVKDGKYRVTVRSLQLTGDITYKKISTKDNLTHYACKNSGTVLSQDWCKPNMLGLLDQAFTDKLQYIEKEKKKEDGDW